jgi:HEAT repeat protein
MGHKEEVVTTAARRAFAQMSLQPDSMDITQASAQKWWDDNHDISPKVWLSEQLKSDDPYVVVTAAAGLYELREKSVVPAIIKVMAGNNRRANEKALTLLLRITGNDWGYSPTATPEERLKIVKQMEDWWKQTGNRFEWIEDRDAKPAAGAAAKPVDPLLAMVNQLASFEGNEAQQAEQNLTSRGNEAVPTLLKGLKNPSVIVRRKCNDILKMISKKDVGYDPRSDEIVRDKAIKAWVTWATAEGIVAEPEKAE